MPCLKLIYIFKLFKNLKASSNFIKLQAAWNDAEEQISAARRYYNAAVTEYNNSIQTFPMNMLVDTSKFSSKKVFEIEETERKNISAKDISFSFISNRMYCTIPNQINLFEPALFESFLNFDFMQKSYNTLMLCTNIISDLNLNLMIWTKE